MATRKAWKILEKRCLGCHGIGQTLGKLDLRTRETALRGGNRGPALLPGQPARSTLFSMVSGAKTPPMPPMERLGSEEVAALKAWIAQGSVWPAGGFQAAASQTWWSFAPARNPRVPAPKRPGWARNPVDAFVLTKLSEKGLSPGPEAPRRVLIRRAYLDLIGLPPPPEEVEAFVKDPHPDAWERLVDRLLASPHYGERWARHWLDVVRYADSGGFEGDKDRPNAWRYRDYVVNAFNTDKPYTEFLREQIAGDEIQPRTNEAVIATGYLAAGPQDIVMVNDKNRADELDDLVATTGSAFLGLTLGCARCHDHKTDPVRQEDYYRLAAIFAPTERREIDVPTPEEKRAADAENARIDGLVAPLKAQLEPLRQRGESTVKAAGKPKPSDEEVAAALGEKDRAEFLRLAEQIKKAEADRPQIPKAYAVTDKGREFGPTHLLIRGEPGHKGKVVEAGFVASLPGGTATVPPEEALSETTGRRTALAAWLARPDHPLTFRVWVNRVWRHHFGRGIVNTPSNFGITGETPSHPELLDWLAGEFARNGYRTKPLHRLIMTSAAYRQSSAVRAEAARTDPQNRLLWRYSLRRIEAEAIRDSILSVAGSLNLAIGGPPVYPPVDPTLRADTFQGINWPEGEDSEKTWRRSLYVKVKRSLLFPALEVFDCPEISHSVGARNVTTTPNQALTLLNDPLVLRQAVRFAERIRREAGSRPAAWVNRAFRIALGRGPTANERSAALGYLQSQPLEAFCHVVLNLNEFVTIH